MCKLTAFRICYEKDKYAIWIYGINLYLIYIKRRRIYVASSTLLISFVLSFTSFPIILILGKNTNGATIRTSQDQVSLLTLYF